MPAPRVQPAVMNKLVDQLAVLVSAREEARLRFRIDRRATTDSEGERKAEERYCSGGVRLATDALVLARAHPRDKE